MDTLTFNVTLKTCEALRKLQFRKGDQPIKLVSDGIPNNSKFWNTGDHGDMS